MNELQMSPKAITEDIPRLANAMDKFVETSTKLQDKLIFWTRVMAIALVVQIIFIIITLFR